MKNYYAILEVPVGSDISEIREAYRRLVQENLWNKEVFAELKEAYEVLSTPGRRREYDQANFGQAFGGSEPMTQGNTETDSRCPLQAGPQCPVINGRTTPADAFCPECGFLLSAMPSEGFTEAVPEADIAQQPRFEEANGERTHRLRTGINSVGREAADILLTDKTVSRRHAQVELTETGQTYVEDLGSTNGTRIFEAVLPPHDRRALQNGDVVRFGSVSLVLFLPQSEPLSTAEAAEPSPGVMLSEDATDAPAEYPEEVPLATASEDDAPADEDFQAEEAPALARLIGERHGTPVREDRLVPGVTTFGRRSDSTIVLRDDPYISGAHAQIIADEGTFRLTDLGSTNGTFLNGQRLIPNEPALLQPGDKIGIGGMTYTFTAAAAGEEMPDDQEETAEAPILEGL